MPVDEELLKILVCPETHQSLHLAGEDLIAELNRKIEAGELVNREGDRVTEKIDAGLIREDGKYLYPIREDIPIMLIPEAIPLPPETKETKTGET